MTQFSIKLSQKRTHRTAQLVLITSKKKVPTSMFLHLSQVFTDSNDYERICSTLSFTKWIKCWNIELSTSKCPLPHLLLLKHEEAYTLATNLQQKTRPVLIRNAQGLKLLDLPEDLSATSREAWKRLSRLVAFNGLCRQVHFGLCTMALCFRRYQHSGFGDLMDAWPQCAGKQHQCSCSSGTKTLTTTEPKTS